MESFIYRPIGVVHSPYKHSEEAPIQGYMKPEEEAQVEIYSEFAEGLKDVEGFSHIILLYHFHRSGAWRPLVKPFLDNQLRGVFATRAPSRPNSIGLTIVRLIKRDKNVLHIAGIDMLEGTPILDIKPYVSDFDIRGEVKGGWLDRVSPAEKRQKIADNRFISENKEGE